MRYTPAQVKGRRDAVKRYYHKNKDKIEKIDILKEYLLAV